VRPPGPDDCRRHDRQLRQVEHLTPRVAAQESCGEQRRARIPTAALPQFVTTAIPRVGSGDERCDTGCRTPSPFGAMMGV
jgi:hypothetical protein